LSFQEFALKWTKSQHFNKLYHLKKIVTGQIQIRHVSDRIRKENTKTSLMDWKIIMFDHESKWFEVFQSSFYMSNLKMRIWGKNMRIKELTSITNQFMVSQNLLYNFLNEFLIWFFLQDLMYLRLISNNPQYYRKSRLQWTPLHKILNRKIIINHFQNWIFESKTRLQKVFFKNINCC